ncbi:MAG: molybdenum ABC transporter ATP-binding protein [SAR86 cluster bacterium]|uniref:Molybdenum ABC transporter ATP-binding protein n=1 Tax=SAR86 cluster bacterium TaxID=2030880 RepID=A0A2A4X331_9GAMM|nr:MAG: molybdenum ABC transporter ATP-binding protein [SAR86 cluster bacterium]
MIEAALQLSKSDFKLDACFSVPGRGVTAVFGPSGCGKTTLLRAIAGLEPDTRGSLSVNAEQWLGAQGCRAVEERRVGVVFQNPSLFPHLTVEENLLYGRRRLRKVTKLIETKELIASLEIEKLLLRYPEGLSGGEKQRVALGRALLAEPKLLLMDEPLSALDQSSREKLMLLLESFLQEIDIPVFYVTHSSEEVARLADNLVLLADGAVTDHGSIQDVLGAVDGELSRSDTAFSVIEGQIATKQLPGLISVDCGTGIVFQVPDSTSMSGKRYQPGSGVRLRIRARDVSLCLEQPKQSSILNILPAVIAELAAEPYNGSRVVKLDMAGKQLLSKISEYSVQQLELRAGQSVFAQIKSAALI